MTTPNGPALLAAALAAAARGWHVFPLTPNAKRPAITGWEQRATNDPDRIRRCWSAGPYNVGIATGPSGLLVVDLDTPKDPDDQPPPRWAGRGITDGLDVFAARCEEHGQPAEYGTHAVRTGRDGRHLYFDLPAGLVLRNTTGRLGWKIDTRAGGGYVVGAGSTVNSRPYTVIHDTDPVPLPDWVATLLTPAPTAPVRSAGPLDTRAVRDASAFASAALRNEVRNVRTAPKGTSNAALTRAARALGRFVASGELPRYEVEDALKSAGEARGIHPRDCAATITCALNWSIAHNPAAA